MFFLTLFSYMKANFCCFTSSPINIFIERIKNIYSDNFKEYLFFPKCHNNERMCQRFIYECLLFKNK